MDSVTCPLASAAAQWGDRIALRNSSQSMSYREYDCQVRRTAGNLRQSGINRADRVAILLDSSIDYPVLLLSLFRLGALACPVSSRLPAKSVESALSQLQCRAVITDRDLTSYARNNTIACLHPRAMIAPEEDIREYLPTEIMMSQPATILFTSGSSGEPKAIVHSFANHYYSALGSNRNITFGPGETWLLSLPLFHVGGLGILFRAVLAGGSVWIPGIGDSIGQTLVSSRATHLSVVPTQLFRLLESDTITHDLCSNVKAILVGGGPLSPTLLDRALSLGLPIYSSYGLTETASQVTSTAPNASRDELHTAGSPLQSREICISLDNEILVRGKTLCLGSLHGSAVTPLTDPDGWFHTGDLGYLDEGGRLVVTGRRDNMFISGGENVHPEEIEAALLAIAGVRQAVVVPLPDREFGFRPVAFVQTSDSSQIDSSAFEDHVRSLLPGFKVPVRFLPLPPDLESAGLKPNRRIFADLAVKLINETA